MDFIKKIFFITQFTMYLFEKILLSNFILLQIRIYTFLKFWYFKSIKINLGTS